MYICLVCVTRPSSHGFYEPCWEACSGSRGCSVDSETVAGIRILVVASKLEEHTKGPRYLFLCLIIDHILVKLKQQGIHKWNHLTTRHSLLCAKLSCSFFQWLQDLNKFAHHTFGPMDEAHITVIAGFCSKSRVSI